MDALFDRRGGGAKGYRLIPGAAEIWPEHQARVIEILKARSRAMSETDERNRRWMLALGVDPKTERLRCRTAISACRTR